MFWFNQCQMFVGNIQLNCQKKCLASDCTSSTNLFNRFVSPFDVVHNITPHGQQDRLSSVYCKGALKIFFQTGFCTRFTRRKLFFFLSARIKPERLFQNWCFKL